MLSPPPPSVSETRLPLKIVFMGTPQLAAHILERLLTAGGRDFSVVGVVTRPDQPRGRGLKLEPSEVAGVAQRSGLPVLKPARIRTPDFLADLRSFGPDLLVVAAYGRILPNDVLAAARIMPINVHASLLPKFRGASPVEAAILDGEPETGVTIMRVTERMDAGPILLQRGLQLASDEIQGTLKEKIAELGAVTLIEALELLIRGELQEVEQDETRATYTSPITKEHAIIDWASEAVQIERLVRAYDPWPVARTRLDGEDLLIWRSQTVPYDMPSRQVLPGTLTLLDGKPKSAATVVQCGAGMLELLEVQAAGRRRMAAADFMRGRRVSPGTRLGS